MVSHTVNGDTYLKKNFILFRYILWWLYSIVYKHAGYSGTRNHSWHQERGRWNFGIKLLLLYCSEWHFKNKLALQFLLKIHFKTFTQIPHSQWFIDIGYMYVNLATKNYGSTWKNDTRNTGFGHLEKTVYHFSIQFNTLYWRKRWYLRKFWIYLLL